MTAVVLGYSETPEPEVRKKKFATHQQALPFLALLLFLLFVAAGVCHPASQMAPRCRHRCGSLLLSPLVCGSAALCSSILSKRSVSVGLGSSSISTDPGSSSVPTRHLLGCYSLHRHGEKARRSSQPQLGEVLCRPQDQRSIEFATAAVQPGESLFVFPYQPIWYSLTGGRNPTYYDFLQPGMMTAEDESKTLRELEANSPQWVIWHNLPVKAIFAIWPNSNPSTFKFPRIENFIRTNYRQVRPPDPTARYSVAVFGRVTPTGAALAP